MAKSENSKIPEGREEMIFSWEHYKVKDFEKTASFFQAFEKSNLFTIEKINPKKQTLKGAFLRPYPKGHWNPLAKMPGAIQVMGGAELKNGTLVIDTKTKGGLKGIKEILEENLGQAIEFEKDEYKDWRELVKK
jgi:hypothetical protein